MVQLTVASRLHLGLLSIPQTGESPPSGPIPTRRFGGAGLMVNDPGLSLSIQESASWKGSGPLCERAIEFGRLYAQNTHVEKAFEIIIHKAPPEHVGLGVGTQLGLAVARGIAKLVGHEDNVIELAQQVARGDRSAIGIHGARCGGFLVEAGKLAHEPVSPLIFQHSVPSEWRVLLVIPQSSGTWHGDQERDAFARLPSSSKITDSLCRLLLLGMIPALQAREFLIFAECVEEFNARVGEMFAPVQGGPYSSPEVQAVVNRLKEVGAKGIGQSSWGPTVFALAADENEARRLAEASLLECVVTSVWKG